MSFVVGVGHINCDVSAGCPCKLYSISISLWTAAEHGRLDIVIDKIRKNPAWVNKKDDYGYTPLHYAAQRNHTEIISYLLANNADPNSSDCGAAPIHRAAFSDAYEACVLLLQANADINIQDKSFGDLNTPLLKAYLQNNNRIIKLLIENGADMNIKNKEGMSYIHYLSSDKAYDYTNTSTKITHLVELKDQTKNTIENLYCVMCDIGSSSPQQVTDDSKPCCSVCGQHKLTYAPRNLNNQLICMQCKYK
eukprot:gene4069-5813_t